MTDFVTDASPAEPSEASPISGDRRKPVARYVQFGDEAVQDRFTAAAEKAYQALVSADAFEGLGQVELRTAPPTERRGLFRKAAPAPTEVVAVTAALARVAQTASGTAAALSEAKSCSASVRVAQILSSVATDLVRDLIALPPTEQSDHAAYRQTLRLGGELEALRVTMAAVGCTDPVGCVGVRSPEHWGRRLEDVEVDEVRDVLLQLAIAGKDDYR